MNSILAKKLKDVLYFLCGIILIALLFQIASFIKNDSTMFPNVFEIIKRFFTLFGEGSTYVSIGYTILHLIIALALGVTIGGILGFFGGFYEPVRKILKPLLSVLKSAPVIVVIILVMIISKYAYTPVISATLIIIPLFYEAVSAGVQSIDKKYIDVYKMQSNFNLLVLIRVYIPLIANNIKEGLSNSIGMGLKIVITAEYIAGIMHSLGYDVFTSLQIDDYVSIYAYSLIMILLVALIELVPYGVSYIVNKRLFKN